jgi:hypothetical protein
MPKKFTPNDILIRFLLLLINDLKIEELGR